MVPFAEGAVTRLRREFKLLLHRSEAEGLISRLHEEQGESSVDESELATLITSVYFDRPNHQLYRRALETPENCLKVRTKEYFPDLGRKGEARVVFELKRERNSLTQKRRVWLERGSLASMLGLKGPAGSVSSSEQARQIGKFGLNGALTPVLAVTYRRRVFQRCEAWRVTVDDALAFRPIDPHLALSAEALSPDRLGGAGYPDGRVVVEVKHMGAALPGWLAALQRAEAKRFSKFAEGMTRLYGQVRSDGVQGG